MTVCDRGGQKSSKKRDILYGRPLTGGRNKYLHGYQWMSEKNVQQE